MAETPRAATDYVYIPNIEPDISYEMTRDACVVRVTAKRVGGGRLYRLDKLLEAMVTHCLSKGSQ